MYGTRHVLVLADLPLSTRTFELEKMVEQFKDRGVVIRWVNDTVALAVFRSPSIGNYITYFFNELHNWLAHFGTKCRLLELIICLYHNKITYFVVQFMALMKLL